MSQESRMLALLERAQEGDEDATREVALHVFTTNKHRIRDLYTIDPAVGREDLESTFFEGIVRAISNAESYVERWRTQGGAHPLKHLGQRGVWAVLSEIRSLGAAIKKREFVMDDADPFETIEDANQEDFREVVVERIGAQSVVRVIARSSLRGRSREVVDLILKGELGDPTELGLNQRLSETLGVTPQRASQIMDKLRKEVAAL